MDGLLLFYIDPLKATEDLPLLAKLSPDEEKVVRSYYFDILKKKDVSQIESLRSLYKTKVNDMETKESKSRNTPDKKRTAIYAALRDQYSRILDMLEHHLHNRPI